ncbi:MAG: alpha/beta hydrolase [Kofleriaceae bacterium]|nr:alpha/beta hydrolase [Kofleriaceae bacterium]MCB9573843.1 alpha/beta hydrolase [Kofleriaceae bacterium]
MPYVDLADARLFYDTAGDDGTPVLLIMGFGVPGHLWLNQIPTLATRHRVAWFDNAGAGRTLRARRRPPTMRDLGRHAIAVLDALGWPAAHVVGVSMGGMIAQEVALGHRARIRSLTLVVTHAGGLRNLVPPPASLALFARGFLGPRRHRVRALERLIFPDDYLRDVDVTPLRDALGEHVVAAAPAADRLRQVAAVLTHRTAPRLPRLAGTPTLVVVAARDRLVRPRQTRRLHQLIPGSRLLVLADAGHAVLHQCADRLNAALLEHFAHADAGTAGFRLDGARDLGSTAR